MSRLYIRARGNKGEVTRASPNRATAEIAYNFDGGQFEVGYFVLRAAVEKDGSVRFTVYESHPSVPVLILHESWTRSKKEEEFGLLL